jgi:hypothetical protein
LHVVVVADEAAEDAPVLDGWRFIGACTSLIVNMIPLVATQLLQEYANARTKSVCVCGRIRVEYVDADNLVVCARGQVLVVA